MSNGYKLSEIPPREDGSRFALSTSSGGRGMSKGQVLATNIYNLVATLEKAAVLRTPEEKSLRLYAIVTDGSGSYTLRDRGTHTGPVIYECTEEKRPGRFGKLDDHPGQIVDALVLGEGTKANDTQTWSAALATAEQESLKGDDLRRFSDSIARALIVRAGLAPVHPSALPQEHLRAAPYTLPGEDEPDGRERPAEAA